jgi:hypothetical protein
LEDDEEESHIRVLKVTYTREFHKNIVCTPIMEQLYILRQQEYSRAHDTTLSVQDQVKHVELAKNHEQALEVYLRAALPETDATITDFEPG